MNIADIFPVEPPKKTYELLPNFDWSDVTAAVESGSEIIKIPALASEDVEQFLKKTGATVIRSEHGHRRD